MMRFQTIIVAALALAAGVANAFSYPYCATKYYIPYEKYYGKPITDATLSSNGQTVAKGPGSRSKELADVQLNGQDLYFETKQIGFGKTGVFMVTNAKAQLVNCQRALSGYVAYGRLPSGGRCRRVVLPFLKTYCQRNRAAVDGKIIAGRNARVVKTSYIFLGPNVSAAGTDISAKAKDKLVIDSTVKASLEDKLLICKRQPYGWKRTRCIKKAQQSTATSKATVFAKGDNVKSDVSQFAKVDDQGAISQTSVYVKSSSG